MNVVQAIREYVSKMISEQSGMKALILDQETTGIVSMVFTQSQILQKEVFLVERIDRCSPEKMLHLKALCFLRPTNENIRLLCKDLREPKYGEYHLFFSNTIKRHQLEDLAEADHHESVHQVQEYFADYYAVTSDLFTVNVPSVLPITTPDWDQPTFERIVDGVISVMLSLKKSPIIRYQKTSELCRRIAQEITLKVDQERVLFDFRKSGASPLLLFFDRREDPCTPLLQQWTYQAMVHELIGIQNNRVDMSYVPGIKPDMKEIILSAEQDPFLQSHMLASFGELGQDIKQMVDEFGQKTKTNQNINTLADIQRFVESYPEFRKMSSHVSKHVALMHELSRIIDVRNLMEVSQLEQELAVNEDCAGQAQEVMKMLRHPRISPEERIKLVLLYALRYETDGRSELANMIDELHSSGTDAQYISLASTLLDYAGTSKRMLDLFSKKSFGAITKGAIMRGLKGVENVYFQHEPLLTKVLDQAIKGNLKENEFPFGGNSYDPRHMPKEIIVFIVGGATYEEQREVRKINSSNSGVKIVLGGNAILNSKHFLDELVRVSQRMRQ